MSAQYQAVHVKPAFNTADHATDDYDVRKFNATTTSQMNATVQTRPINGIRSDSNCIGHFLRAGRGATCGRPRPSRRT